MKTYSKSILLAIVILFFATSSFAGETLKQFGDVKGRTFHSDSYDAKSCNDCHNSKQPLSLPADDACLSCHDLNELVASTARGKGEELQNPHDNMHYGKETPCMECHGEHMESKPLCAGCHSFKYPKYKK
jgi:DnaJ-class molecular chaperone